MPLMALMLATLPPLTTRSLAANPATVQAYTHTSLVAVHLDLKGILLAVTPQGRPRPWQQCQQRAVKGPLGN